MSKNPLAQTFKAFQPKLPEKLASQQIRFSFIHPGSPQFAVYWERENQSLKAALQVTIGAQAVTEEVLRTVLVEIEGILNS